MFRELETGAIARMNTAIARHAIRVYFIPMKMVMEIWNGDQDKENRSGLVVFGDGNENGEVDLRFETSGDQCEQQTGCGMKGKLRGKIVNLSCDG
ncbi:hypothetical protein L1987_81213 [Smallanthus sonchifolius]|uniref:Uncharacterized protein n=1 Tax=Smallanthus sonchifolius TaxID=185202 RepID=A0ACB8YPZ7_9ASTR|nr:hypothetical protein L1987_81213 [Smallanthus sonchifolius]